jgi:hypothetical protein
MRKTTLFESCVDISRMPNLAWQEDDDGDGTTSAIDGMAEGGEGKEKREIQFGAAYDGGCPAPAAAVQIIELLLRRCGLTDVAPRASLPPPCLSPHCYPKPVAL